jgi:hypothetical protein
VAWCIVNWYEGVLMRSAHGSRARHRNKIEFILAF